MQTGRSVGNGNRKAGFLSPPTADVAQPGNPHWGLEACRLAQYRHKWLLTTPRQLGMEHKDEQLTTPVRSMQDLAPGLRYPFGAKVQTIVEFQIIGQANRDLDRVGACPRRADRIKCGRWPVEPVENVGSRGRVISVSG